MVSPQPPSFSKTCPLTARRIELFLEVMSVERGASENTLAAYQRDLQSFFQAANFLSCDKIEIDHIRSYLKRLDEKGYAPASKARKLSTLKQFFAHGVEEGHLQTNPTAALRPSKREKTLPKILEEADIQALLTAAKAWPCKEGLRLSFMLELLYATGLRVSEMLTLPVAPFGQLSPNSSLSWVCVKGKGKKERLVPLPPSVIDALAPYQKVRLSFGGSSSSKWLFPSRSKEGHLTRQRFGQLLKELAGRAGLNPNNISPHIVRHAFATHLLNRGADLLSVQKLLGHADISTTEIYTHVMTDRLQDLIACHPLSESAKTRKGC